VQPGDTLFRIALSYNITYPRLQRANCMGSSTIIYTGQRLWVPNIATRTPSPGVTIIPTFPTATQTPLPTITTAPPTDTELPPATPIQETPITPNP
jgi:LysM repeat protein